MSDTKFVLSDIDQESVEIGWHVALVNQTENLSGHGKGAWLALVAAVGKEHANTLVDTAENGSTRISYNEDLHCNQLVATDSEDDILYTIFYR